MAKTRSKLVAAKLVELDKSGNPSGASISCMFNPHEYTISKSNTYSEEPRNRSTTPRFEFTKAGAQTLKLNLLFDTYETGKDVSLITNKLWKFMEPKDVGNRNNKKEPPGVAFEWGVFRFVAVITNMTQKFTLFTLEGTPVRANVDVTFTQHVDENDYPGQNPTSGGGLIQQMWPIIRGDRLDTIAAKVYDDAAKWRLIAEHNGIDNPLILHTGRALAIPQELP
jgi:hypothetical protein